MNTPESHHFVTLAPLICLFVALGLDLARRALVRAVPATRRLAPALTVLAVGALVAWNLDFYFREYTPRNNFGGRPTESATAIGRHLAAHPGRYVYFVAPPFAYLGIGSIAFLAGSRSGTTFPSRFHPRAYRLRAASRSSSSRRRARTRRPRCGGGIREARSGRIARMSTGGRCSPPHAVVGRVAATPELGRGHTQWGETGSGQSVALNSSHRNGATRRYTRTGGWS